MAQIKLTLTSQQPILATIQSETAFVQHGADHIPGSAVRGALAGAWIVKNGIPQLRTTSAQGEDIKLDDSQEAAAREKEFIALFEGDVRFGHAESEALTRTPLSAKLCKHTPSPHCRTFGVDLAYPETIPATIPPSIADPGPQGLRCTVCSGELKDGKGEIAVTHVRRTRTAVNRDKGSSLQGHLFSQELLSEGTEFTAVITTPGEFTRAQEEWLLGPKTLRIGGQRTVMGRTKCVATIGEEPDLPESWRLDDAHVVRLLSPAILLDNFGRPTMRLEAELARITHRVNDQGSTNLAVPTVKQHWARPIKIAGWNVAAGLPKPEEWALAAGSTFIIEAFDGVEKILDELSQGIGHRRREGFGAVAVNPTPWNNEGIAADSAISAAEATGAQGAAGPKDDQRSAWYAVPMAALFGSLSAQGRQSRESRNRIEAAIRDYAAGTGREAILEKAFWAKSSPTSVENLARLLDALDSVRHAAPPGTNANDLVRPALDWIAINSRGAR